MTTTADETTTPRCRTCGRVEVPEHVYDCPSCVGGARQDLRAIVDLYATLPAEVEHRGVNSEALVLLGPSADPEARGHLEASVAAGRVNADLLEDGTGTHPLWTVGTLAMIVRDALGHDEPDDRATVAGEAGYLDGQLTTLSHDAWFDFRDLRRSVAKCRAHLEDVLRAGDRPERTQVPCLDCGARLERVWAAVAMGDHHACPACKRRYDGGSFARAKADWLADAGADRFVLIADAVAAIDRPERTLRTWIARGLVTAVCDRLTHRLKVWWPDVRHAVREAEEKRIKSAA